MPPYLVCTRSLRELPDPQAPGLRLCRLAQVLRVCDMGSVGHTELGTAGRVQAQCTSSVAASRGPAPCLTQPWTQGSRHSILSCCSHPLMSMSLSQFLAQQVPVSSCRSQTPGARTL